jgi:hypothetical protein
MTMTKSESAMTLALSADSSAFDNQPLLLCLIVFNWADCGIAGESWRTPENAGE